VAPIVHGRADNGEFLSVKLPTITMPPNALVEMNLQEQITRSGAPLRGVAGVQVSHDGFATDLVSELINVEEAGRFAWFDATRIVPLHQATKEMVISFSLAPGRQSLIILQNATDRRQSARVVLEYENGTQQYNVKLPEIERHRNFIIDIKRLRDDQVRDVSGKLLPVDLQFGGAVVLHEPGAFVVSDPTIIVRPTIRLRDGSTGVGNQGSNDKPIVQVGKDVPTVLVASCTAFGPGTVPPPPPPDQPPPQKPRIFSVTVWINAFIPKIFENLTVELNRHPGKTIIKSIPFGCFNTNQREFSDFIRADSKAHSEVVLDLSGPVPVKQWEYHECFCTYKFDCSNEDLICVNRASNRRMKFGEPRDLGNSVIEIRIDAAANNPCVEETVIAGDIDYHGIITVNTVKEEITFAGTIDQFPAYEMYAFANDGFALPVFLKDPVPGSGPFQILFTRDVSEKARLSVGDFGF
jgi:hypothetical protein